MDPAAPDPVAQATAAPAAPPARTVPASEPKPFSVGSIGRSLSARRRSATRGGNRCLTPASDPGNFG